MIRRVKNSDLQIRVDGRNFRITD